LANLSIGRRDARLLTLREWTFGSTIVSVADCLKCGERLELEFDTSEIRTLSSSAPAPETFALCTDGYDVTFRLPNSRDLMALATDDSLSEPLSETANIDEAARRQLLSRCMISARQIDTQHGDTQHEDTRHKGIEVAAADLPHGVGEAVAAQMNVADPQALVELALQCPQCRHRWLSIFDIGSFFWDEIDGWAHRLLREIHVLASHYGWRESDILALSPQRRRTYIDMIAASAHNT
ncbi:MAG: hypothetical protein M3R15_35700, partial [Acidobacteriota bacterium]|nr:hypothetical protein [Acidobacteriota bacterium]